MMGCDSAKNAAPVGTHLATSFASIAQVVSHQKGAGNSIGYQTLVYSFSVPVVNVAQYWFEALFLPENLSPSNGLTSGDWAESSYIEHLQHWFLDNKCPDTESTPNWGWDSWVVTNTNPILDRGSN
jgi:hypothetical protein